MIKSITFRTKKNHTKTKEELKHDFYFSSGLNVISGANDKDLYVKIFKLMKNICFAQESSRSSFIPYRQKTAPFANVYLDDVITKKSFVLKKSKWAVFFENPNSSSDLRSVGVDISDEELESNDAAFARMEKFLKFVDKDTTDSYNWIEELVDKMQHSKNIIEREWYIEQQAFECSNHCEGEDDPSDPSSMVLCMPTDYLNFQQKLDIAKKIIDIAKYMQVIILTDCPIITGIEEKEHFYISKDTFERNKKMIDTWRNHGAINLIEGYNTKEEILSE